MKKGKIQKFISRLGKIGISFLMILTTLNLGRISNAFAANAENANNFPKKDVVTYNGKITWSGNIVGDFTINGRQAFCMAHPKPTPGSGTSLTTNIYNNDNVRKVLYYGWEGPGQWNGFTSKEKGVVITSLALSYYYYGDKSTKDIDEFLDYVKNKTVPNFDVKFNKSKIQAYKDDSKQKTETITLTSDSNLFGVTITLHDKMTYVDETHGTSQTGGSVTIKGQTKFHFEAPLNVNLGVWKSGDKTKHFAYQPLVGQPSNSSYQPVGRGNYVTDPDDTTSLEVDWLSLGNLKIAKQDNKGNVVPNTQFKISYNSDMTSPIGTYTTTSDGSVTINDLTPQNVYIQETSVPNHLVLDNTVHSIEIKTGETVTFTQTNNWKQGYIEVTKYDKKTNQIVKKSGTQFEILKGSTVVSTITTNANGVAKSGLLDYDTYTVREKSAPQNYVIATLTQNQDVVENNKTYSIKVYNEPVLGSVNLTKVDADTNTSVPQGDATLVDAEYVLKANENILNPSDGSVLYAKDEAISVKNIGSGSWGDTGTKKTDSNAKIKWSNLPMGSYYIQEVNPSNGYLLDTDKHVFSITSSNQTTTVVTSNQTLKEQVIKGQLSIVKVGTTGENSGVIKPLKDVEFTMKLQSEVAKVGWDAAKTYDILVTDTNGMAISKALPYGLYIVRETKGVLDHGIGGDFLVEINEDKEIEYRVVNNVPFQSWLKIVKQDQDGNDVILSSATFKLKDKDGNFVKQKVSGSYVDEWSTDDRGYVFLNNRLEQGEYTIVELKNPEGFLIASDINVHITSSSPYISLDDDNQAVITVYIKDEKPTGKIILNKFFERSEDSALGGAIFKLTAYSDVIDPATGEVIYHKGDAVNIDIAEDGLYVINESGQLIIDGLPLGVDGASYKLEEVKTLDGYDLLEEPVIFNFSIKDSLTKEYTIEKSVENNLTQTSFIKKDADGHVRSGAIYQIKDDKNNIIDEWETTEDPHLIKGLVYGNEYTLVELVAPEGLTIAKDIKFTYTMDTKEIEMIDKKVEASKLDTQFNDIKGAKLQVISTKTKQIVDEWVTDGTVHSIENLIVGNEYILKEIDIPQGYVKAEDIVFTVNDDQQNQSIKMIDKQVIISKIDAHDNRLKGAELSVLDADDNVIDHWISDGNDHYVSGLIEGNEYTLHENQPPQGYLLAQDIQFVVTKEKENQFIKMKDEQVLTDIQVNKVDSLTKLPIKSQDFEFTMYADQECTVVLDIVHANIEDGTATFKNVPYGVVYIKETKAPLGYRLSTEVKKVIINDDLEGVGNIHSFVYENTLLPVVVTSVPTGDQMDIGFIVCLVMGSALASCFLFYRRKKEEE